MIEYIKAQMKTNDLIVNNNVSSDELQRFSNADLHWAENKKKNVIQKRIVKKGEIYQIEFGKNYSPELSYEHRGLIIGVRKKLLLVLPIFSYDPIKHPDVFHPIDFPNSKSDLFLLKQNEFSFIQHDSVVKVGELRTISINRILYKQSGSISITSDTYKLIESFAFQKAFPTFYYDFEALREENKKLKERIKELETEQDKNK